MTDFTVEELVNAIRNSDNLMELKRMVGPSEAESEAAVRRLEKIDRIWARNEKQYGCDSEMWPYWDKESYDRLMAEQGLFEREYC